MKDLIERQAAIDALKNQMSDRNDLYNIPVRRSIVILEQLPSAQPDLDEWCTDCKEYDAEKHHCPRYNRVIREALKDAQLERKTGKWEMLQIPINPPVYKCSVCGKHAIQTTRGCLVNRHYESYLSDFCPNCGSDNRIKHTDASPYDSHDPMPEPYKERKNETDNSNQTN